jgi:hypothetical protein
LTRYAERRGRVLTASDVCQPVDKYEYMGSSLD